MKKILCICLFGLFAITARSQSVGVGTTSPHTSAALDITSTTKGMLIPRMTTAERNAIATPATGLLVFDNTTNSFWLRGTSAWLELSDNLDTEVFRNGPDKIYMALTDSVGIGTNNPAAKLDVKTNINNYGISHTDGTIRLSTYIGDAGGIGAISNHSFRLFANNGLQQFQLMPSGNIGIGLSNPQNRVDIAHGTARTGPHATGLALYVTGDMFPSSGGAEFRHANGTQGVGIGYNTIYAAGTHTSQNLTFASKGIEGTLLFNTNAIERMRITASGQVGIGTATPHAQLQLATSVANRKLILYEVADNDHQFNGFGINGDGALRYQIANTLNDHTFFAASGTNSSNELMRIKGDGNVGIGISNPQNRVDIAHGTARTGTHATGAPLYVTGNMGGSSGGAEFRLANGTQGVGIGFNTIYAAGTQTNQDITLLAKGTGGLYLSTGNATIVTVRAPGNVGIGTTAPHAPLQFASTLANRKLVLYEGADNDHEYHGFGVNFGTMRYQIAASTDDHVFYAAVNNTTSNELMRIKGTGAVGIGTSTPHAQLQLATSVANRKLILYEVADNDHQYHGFGINGDGALRYQTANTLNDHIFYAATSSGASNELARIKGDGNLSISGSVIVENFIAPTLLNGFTNYGVGYSNAAYYKDKMGRVHLRGMVSNVNNPSGLVVFTLPVGYRPSTSGILLFSTISNAALGRVDVLANGNVLIHTGSAGWISLDGISFRAD